MGRWMLGPLIALAVLSATVLPVYGQDSETQAETSGPTIYEGPVGPYRMIVQAIPYPLTQGLINLHATVWDLETGAAAEVEQVRVLFVSLESSERGRTSLRKSPDIPDSYSTQLNLLEPGAWTFTFDVSGPLGEGSAEVDLVFASQPRTLAGWLAWAGMALALLLVLALAWRNANRMRRSRAH